MRWLATIAVGPVPESAVDPLIANLPTGTKPVFVGYGNVMRLSLVNFRVEASSEAEASALGLQVFTSAATNAGLSLQPEVRRVEKA